MLLGPLQTTANEHLTDTKQGQCALHNVFCESDLETGQTVASDAQFMGLSAASIHSL